MKSGSRINRRKDGRVLCEVQGQEADERCQRSEDEERASRHERPLPGLRDGDVPNSLQQVIDRAQDRGSLLIEAHDKALLAARAALNKHAESVVVMDLRRVSTVADFFVLGTALSSPQLAAIAEEIEEQLRPSGERVWHVEGLAAPTASGAGGGGSEALLRRSEATASQRRARSAEEGFRWVLVDCGDVVIHLFSPTARTFYQLERLWGDAPQIPLDPVQLPSA